MQPARRPLVAALLALASLGIAPAASAQDSFHDPLLEPGRAAQQPMQPQKPQKPQTAPPLQQGSGRPAPAEAASGFTGSPASAAGTDDDLGETQDFGIAPTSQLRPTAQLHGPTPTSIPGGRVVGTRQLAQWMQEGQQGRQGRVMLLHAIASNEHLPNAIPAAPASQGGSFEDQVQREFAQYLEQATGGDRSRLIVTYCAGVQCWGSYNAALRAIRMGYRNVHWYRGGLEAWGRAGLPLLTGNGQSVAPAQNTR